MRFERGNGYSKVRKPVDEVYTGGTDFEVKATFRVEVKRDE